MYKLIYSIAAENDLDDIFNFIANDNKKRALDFVNELEKTIIKLQDFPLLGTECKYKELAEKKIRILIHKKYLIFYKISNNKIHIIRIINGAVNYKDLF